MTPPKDVEEMLGKAEGIARAYGISMGANTVNVKIDGGGYGVVICVMCVIVMLVMVVNNTGDIDKMERHTADALSQMRSDIADRSMQAQVARSEHKSESDQEFNAIKERLETQQAYLNAIYQQSGTPSK